MFDNKTLYNLITEVKNTLRRHKHDKVETESLTLQGITAPSFKPLAVGLIYCDTTNAKVYISTGTSTSSDWQILN